VLCAGVDPSDQSSSTMLKSIMTSLCPILIIVAAAVAALYRRISRLDSSYRERVPRREALLPIVSKASQSMYRPPSRQQKESLASSPAQGEADVVVVLGSSSARIAGGSGGAFMERVTISEFGSSPGDSTAPTTSSSPLRTCCAKAAVNISPAESDVQVQRVTADVLLPHPQLPRIRVS
jgi:hypothetical protein